MGNFSESYTPPENIESYTDFRWIKQLNIQKKLDIEKSYILYSPLNLLDSYKIEKEINLIKNNINNNTINKNNFSENFTKININNETYKKIKIPIKNNYLIYRKNRLSRNSFKLIKPYNYNILNELSIFYYESIFYNFKIDLEDNFIVNFVHHYTIMHKDLINSINNFLHNHLIKNHQLNNEKLTFSKLRNMIARDFKLSKYLKCYIKYFVRNINKNNIKDIVFNIIIEEGNIYNIINQLILNKHINENNEFVILYFLLLIFFFDTESNQKEMEKSYKNIQYLNFDLFKEKNILYNLEYMSTTKEKKLMNYFENIIEISYESVFNKNWYLAFKSLDTENISQYFSEKEIIIQPFSIFEVLEIKLVKDNKYYIKLLMKNNALKESVFLDMEKNMQMNYGICTEIGNNIFEYYNNIDLNKIISLTINDKISLKMNKENIGMMKNLRILSLKNLQLNNEDLIEFIPYMKNFTFLSYLNLSCNILNINSIKELSKIMPMLVNLEYIILDQNNLTKEGIIELSKGIFYLNDLRGISLVFNHIKSSGIEHLSKIMNKFSKLKYLNLSTNYIYEEEMDDLVYCINKMKNLTYLNLSNNQIGATGLLLLSKNLPNSIQYLNVRENEINQDGIAEFSKYLNKISNLKYLNLYGCKNGSRGLDILFENLKYNMNLIYLNLGCNLLNDSEIFLIIKNCDNIKNIEEFILKENNLSNDCIEFLTLVLSHWKKLKKLNLSWNNINYIEGIKNMINKIKEENIKFVEFNIENDFILEDESKKILNDFNDDNKNWEMKKNGIFMKKINRLNMKEFSENYIIQEKNENKEILRIINPNLNFLEEKLNNLIDYLNMKKFILTNINLTNNKNIYLKLLSENLKYLTNIKEIDFRNIELGNEGMNEISKNFKFFKYLEKINLSKNFISDQGMKLFSENLNYLENLKKLNLNKNKISDEGIKFLSENKNIKFKLEILLLKENKIHFEGINYLIENINLIKYLKIFNLCFNYLEINGLNILNKNFEKFENLKTLNLSNNQIKKNCFNNLNNLYKLKNLENIFLWNNKIENEGYKIFIDNIKQLKNIKNIDLSDNNLTDDIKNYFINYCEINNINLQI